MNHLKTTALNRRTLLRGVGTLMALPLLDAMAPVGAMAQTSAKAAKPLRAAFLFVPNGVNMEFWRPATAGADYVMPKTLAPLASLRKKINIMSGLTQHNAFALGDGGGDHARSAAAWLTGCHPTKTSGANIKVGVSADQIIAQKMGNKTRFPSLELGIERGGLAGDCDSGYSCAYSSTIAWRTENTPVAKEVNPRDVFERLFGTAGDGANAEARALREAEHKSILDFVLEDAAQLKRQLGSHDRQKLDEYFTGVREIERRLEFVEQAKAGGANTEGMNGLHVPVGIPADYAEHARLMGDMMVLAFQSDLTRACTYMFANEGSGHSYKNLGIAGGHHELSHHGKDPEKLAQLQKINQFHVEQVAYILHKMDSIKEGDGTLLDNTMLVYGGGISDGDRHNHDDLPIIMAGGAGAGIKTGRHIQYENNTPMSNLFLSMFDRMGIPAETIGSVGDSTGKLQQLA